MSSSKKPYGMPEQAHNVVPLNPKGATSVGQKFAAGLSGAEITVGDKAIFSQFLCKHAKMLLSHTEYMLVDYINHNTVGFGYAELETIVDKIIRGKKGCIGWGYSEATYRRTVLSLKAKDVIHHDAIPNGYTKIGINFDWIKKANAMPLPIPKRLQGENQPNADIIPVNMTGSSDQNDGCIKEIT